MKKKHSKNAYAFMCIVFVVSLITIVMSVSYAFLKPKVFGDATESKVEVGTFDIETSLTESSALIAQNMIILNSDEIESKAEKIDFTVKSMSTTSNAGKFNVYLKDISITSELVDTYFKWDLLMDGEVIRSGNFSNIESVGAKSTSKEDTDTTKYFDTYYLGTGINFDGFNQSDMTIRVYLLNNPTVNQNNLMNGTFECKVAVEAYSTNDYLDINYNYYIDSVKIAKSEIPQKNTYYEASVNCTNGVTATWDEENWEVKVTSGTSGTCEVNFTRYYIVYLRTTDDWSSQTPYIYLWSDTNTTYLSYPGAQMTKSDTEENVYYYKSSDNFFEKCTYTIFNVGETVFNSSFKTTPDLDLGTNGQIYELNEVESTKKTVFFNSRYWRNSSYTKINIYLWNSTTKKENASWPGVEMTKISDTGYMITFDDIYDKVIFNDGISQTEDITLNKSNYMTYGYYRGSITETQVQKGFYTGNWKDY